MGKIKKDIAELIKENRSKTKAMLKSRLWFEKASINMRDNSVAFTRDPFKPGMVYVFRYDKPKHIATLPWWDRNPVVLALDPTDTGNDCGINLNLLPVDVKEDLLDLIYERMEGLIKSASSGNKMYNAKTQAPIKLDYKGAKRFLDQFGLGFAIRQYIPNLKQKQKVVSYENWAQIALCDFLELEGITINELRRQFSNYLKNKDI